MRSDYFKNRAQWNIFQNIKLRTINTGWFFYIKIKIASGVVIFGVTEKMLWI